MYGRRTLSCGMLSRRYQLQTPSRNLYPIALVRTDVSEKILIPSSGFELELHDTETQRHL
jgi:hypothetical protein